MKKIWQKIKDFFFYFQEETKKHVLIRYLSLLFIVGLYFSYALYKFGAQQGIIITVLTWSFFVFCTPIADAGFLLAFPLRLLLGIRMMKVQIYSYIFAFFFNLYFIFYQPQIYNKTLILKLFHQILVTPFPYWIIILLSFSGTFFSILFGDELMDMTHHFECLKQHRHITKYKVIVFAFIIFATIILYNFLLEKIGIKIPLC